MIEAVWDEDFKKSYRKKTNNYPQLKNKFWERIELFLNDPFNPILRTHKLSGKLKGSWAFSINNEHRVIFEFISNNKIMFIDFGTRDEVY